MAGRKWNEAVFAACGAHDRAERLRRTTPNFTVTRGRGHSGSHLDGADIPVAHDATASIGTACRQRCGKLRHFEAKWLLVQDEIAAHRLKLRKVPTNVNPVDLATKYFLDPRMRGLLVLLNPKLVETHDKDDSGTVNTLQVRIFRKDWW